MLLVDVGHWGNSAQFKHVGQNVFHFRDQVATKAGDGAGIALKLRYVYQFSKGWTFC